MATGISVKLTADVGSFKKGISEATASVKTLDAQLETNEKQLKLNGDAELYMKNKTALLNKQLEEQRKVVVNTKNALDAMKKNGVSPASTEFQKMEKNLANAQTKMVEIQTNLKEVESGSKGAKTEAQGMNTQLKNIGKGVAFENVTNGLKEITDKLESGAKAAINFGKKIARSAMDSTEWADDVLTRATQYGTDAETIQKMDNVAEFIDTDVDTILKARDKLMSGVGHGKQGTMDALDLLGLTYRGDAEDTFWEAGEALMEWGDEAEKDAMAMDLFGKSWRELVPLFTAGREEYERLMEDQNVLTNDQVKKLGEADDEFKKMEQEVQRLKNEFWAENSQTVIDLLQWLVDNKDGVIVAIEAIGGAFAALKIGEFALNIGKVVSGFKEIIGLGGGGGGAAGGAAGGGAAAAGGGAAAKAGLGGGIMEAMGISAAGFAGGTLITAGIVYAGGKAVANLNDAANAAREVSTDIHRLDNVFGDQRINDIPQELSNAMNGVMKDKRLVLQETVRALLGTVGGSDTVYGQLKYLGYNLNDNVFDAFNYGDGKNKLLDMLNMNGSLTPASAALVLKSAGIDVNDPRLGGYSQSYQEALQYLSDNWYYMKQNGGFSEGYGILTDYFMKSGTFDEEGKWTIPSLKVDELEAPADAAAQIAEQVGTVYIPAQLSFSSKGGASVPTGNSYSSNLYVENMNMNGGMDAAGLADAINSRNRRVMKGYGNGP